MKNRHKNILILTISVLIIIIIIRISYIQEIRSQKLPAVVKADKVYVSTLTSGVVLKNEVQPMAEVNEGERIMMLQNNALYSRLSALKKEKSRYLELIESVQSGDALQLELSKLNKAVLENELKLQETELDLLKIKQQLGVAKPEQESVTRRFKAHEELYENKLISAHEFYEVAEEYKKDISDYNDLKHDSLYAVKKIETVNMLINEQQERINIIKKNPTLLAGDNLVELERVNTEIQDVKNDIARLSINSPARGIVTDINYISGETVKEGDVIAEIANLNSVWIDAYGNSFSRRNVKQGNYVQIYADDTIIDGYVKSVSPVMEKVKSLSAAYETANTYLKIEIKFDNPAYALKLLTPGERLFVRVFFNK